MSVHPAYEREFRAIRHLWERPDHFRPILTVMIAARFLLTAGGLGLLRPAPGSWGSTPPPGLVLVLLTLGVPSWQVDCVLVLVVVLFTVSCVKFGRWAEVEWKRKDPSQVVADEVAGQSITLLFLPWGPPSAYIYNFSLCAIAFVLFRAMDVIKPPPAGGMQRLPHGWGIVVDDLLAGVYALVAMQIIARTAFPAIGITV